MLLRTLMARSDFQPELKRQNFNGDFGGAAFKKDTSFYAHRQNPDRRNSP